MLPAACDLAEYNSAGHTDQESMFLRWRRLAIASKGMRVPISYPRVQTLCGIALRLLHTCSTSLRTRRSLRKTGSTHVIFRGREWHALLAIPPPARGHLQLPLRD